MARRWKRHAFAWLLLALLVATIVVLYVPALHWGLLGLVRGDSFFHGLPTSYWRFQLEGGTDPVERDRAAWELERGGPAALPVLIEILQDRQTHARIEAAQVLEHMGPAARPAAPALREAMEEEDDVVLRYTYWAALKRIAPEEIPPGSTGAPFPTH